MSDAKLSYIAAWKRANPEKVRAYGKVAREKHREKNRIKAKERYDANPKRWSDAKRKRKYGITPEQHAAMIAEQAGACFLCERVTEKLVVDHCHKTGRVRKLLCFRCNIALGHIEGMLDSGLGEKILAYMGRSCLDG